VKELEKRRKPLQIHRRGSPREHSVFKAEKSIRSSEKTKGGRPKVVDEEKRNSYQPLGKEDEKSTMAPAKKHLGARERKKSNSSENTINSPRGREKGIG